MKWTRLQICSSLLALLIAGCGTDGPLIRPPIKPPTVNSTPEETIQSFVFYYEKKDIDSYASLFTGEFLFEFSNSADPDLATEYSDGWFLEDEIAATGHLFAGGVNPDGLYLPHAQKIELSLLDSIPQPDGTMGRDPGSHAALLTPVVLKAWIFSAADAPPDGGTVFEIGVNEPAVHRFFLVRGDQANGLHENQPADENHWYIYLWRDESTAATSEVRSQAAAARAPTPHESTTWGALKGIYR